MIRDDLSQKLVHLTRGDTPEVAASIFESILEQRELLGGDGNIKGGYRCVCFSEAPVSKLANILATPGPHGMRYMPFGVMVDKTWLFSKGGRPVIYQPDSEFELLHESQRFRHVRYEPNDKVDYSWEREWRIRINALPLEPNETTLVVPNRAWEKWLLDQHIAMLGRRAMLLSSIGPGSVSDFPWHFIVLEDLGVKMPKVTDPPN